MSRCLTIAGLIFARRFFHHTIRCKIVFTESSLGSRTRKSNVRAKSEDDRPRHELRPATDGTIWLAGVGLLRVVLGGESEHPHPPPNLRAVFSEPSRNLGNIAAVLQKELVQRPVKLEPTGLLVGGLRPPACGRGSQRNSRRLSFLSESLGQMLHRNLPW